MRVPVLTYHAVLPVDSSAQLRGTVPLSVFREQIAWLRRRGYTSLSLDETADLLEGGEPVARRPLALCFDDGYGCVVEHALDVLEDAGFTATLFVVTGAVGKTTDWYAHKGGPCLEHASWDELERALARGFAIGSHGVDHQPLTQLDTQQLREEVWASREEIAKRLGSCRHFAYPYGACSPQVSAEVRRAGYRTGCTTERGFNRSGQPLETLRRQSISRTTTAARFRRRVGSLW